MTAPIAARALVDGAELSTSSGAVRIRHETIGTLTLPSGRIVAADPCVDPSLPPFARAVPSGSYPVHLAIAQIASNGDERVAAAWIPVGSGEIASWEPARVDGQAPQSRHQRSWYGVDSGTGAFLSAEAAKVAERTEHLGQRLAEAMGPTYRDTWAWCLLPLDESSSLQVAAFSAGWGDGAYGSWWGLDATGNPVLLLTDFDVLDDPSSQRSTGRPWWKFWG